MKKIVLSALAVLTLGTAMNAETITTTEEKFLDRFISKVI